MATSMKFCGLSSPDDINSAVAAGASYIGFVFFAKSARHLGLEQAASLAALVPDGLCKVALTVDADDAELDAILAQVPLDMLQLQGSESVERVAHVKARYGLPVMKAVGVAEPDDLAQVDHYANVADQILVDAKPPKGANLPGGNGIAFDWHILSGRRWQIPWMLAGGLRTENVKEAIAITGANQVDVSSGIETAPGQKDAAKMHAFARAVGATLTDA